MHTREIVEDMEAEALYHRMCDLRRPYPRDPYDCVAQIGIETFRKALLFVLEDDDGIWSFAAIHVGKRKKNIWEPYANWTLAYTAPERRRLGYARELALYMESTCRFLGCARIKSKAGSYLGLRLHWSMGHDAWGFCDTGEIQIDAPLLPRVQFPTRTPMGARAVTKSATPLTGPELHAAIVEREWMPGNDYSFLCVPSSASVVGLLST